MNRTRVSCRSGMWFLAALGAVTGCGTAAVELSASSPAARVEPAADIPAPTAEPARATPAPTVEPAAENSAFPVQLESSETEDQVISNEPSSNTSVVSADTYPVDVVLAEGESVAIIDGMLVDAFAPIERSPGEPITFALLNAFEPDIDVDVTLRHEPNFDAVQFPTYQDHTNESIDTVVEGTVTIPDGTLPGIHRLHFEATGGTTQRSLELYVLVPGQPHSCTPYAFLVNGLNQFEFASVSSSIGDNELGAARANYAGSALVTVAIPMDVTSLTVLVEGEDTGPLEPVEIDVTADICNW